MLRRDVSDSAFDAAVSTQVIEYLADPDAALVELARVLRPGGRLVLIDTDFDSLVWAAIDRDLAARIAAAWDDHCDPHLPCSLLPRLRAAGFAIHEIRIVPILNTEYNPATFSYHLAALIASFVPGHRGISENDATGWLNDLANLQQGGSTSSASIDTSSQHRVRGNSDLAEIFPTPKDSGVRQCSGMTPERPTRSRQGAGTAVVAITP